MLGDICSTFKIWIQNENNLNTETIVLHSIPNGGFAHNFVSDPIVGEI